MPKINKFTIYINQVVWAFSTRNPNLTLKSVDKRLNMLFFSTAAALKFLKPSYILRRLLWNKLILQWEAQSYIFMCDFHLQLTCRNYIEVKCNKNHELVLMVENFVDNWLIIKYSCLHCAYMKTDTYIYIDILLVFVCTPDTFVF